MIYPDDFKCFEKKNLPEKFYKRCNKCFLSPDQVEVDEDLWWKRFCRVSTIHGVHFIADKKLTFCERCK